MAIVYSSCYIVLIIAMIVYMHADQLALADDECHIIDLEQYSNSLESGREVFTGREQYVLLCIESECSTSLPCEMR